MNLDDIQYGNQAEEHEVKIKDDKSGIIASCIKVGIVKDILENHPFPLNSSDETLNELKYLVRITNESDESDLRFCELMELNHYNFFVVVAKRMGLDIKLETIMEWVEEVDPILFYLKDKFNRPRPYQLAKELNLPLYPIIRSDANSAAYPSGHTLDFLTIIYHLGKLKPEFASELDSLYHRIKRVRELSGVHYPSDRKVSEYLFTQLIKYKLIKL
jgi:hypothetical protein